MLDWTDRHARYFLRLLTQRSRLYTEMITAAALVYGKAQTLLAYHPKEHPLAVQLGGCEPDALAYGAELAQEAGFEEVNLNVGCPSERVQSGRFGACLMAEPATVADCIQAMKNRVDIPVTVKCRIGIDHFDSDEFLIAFLESVAEAGCRTFIVHARIAVLKGLSPKENREIPPLNYARVIRMKELFPGLEFVINGGITTVAQAESLLEVMDGVMVGRAAYQNPFLLTTVDTELFGDRPKDLTRRSVLETYIPYMEAELESGTPLSSMTRHILGLYKGQPGARQFRQHLSQHATRPGSGLSVLQDAMAFVN